VRGSNATFACEEIECGAVYEHGVRDDQHQGAFSAIGEERTTVLVKDGKIWCMGTQAHCASLAGMRRSRQLFWTAEQFNRL
jgi:hypothetical protein